MSLAILGLVLLALLCRREFRQLRAWPKPRPATTKATSVVKDPWIATLYPRRYRGRGGDNVPVYVSEHWRRQFRGEDLTPDELDALVVDIAFALELRARRVLSGHQFRGILRGTKTLVWDRDCAVTFKKILSIHRPRAVARPHLDRALAWWSAALGAGMRVFEWDRPGYDEVTAAFVELTDFVGETIVVERADHGVEVETKTVHVPAFVPPPRWGPPLRMGLGFVVWVVTMVVVLGHQPGSMASGRHAPAPLDCATQLERVVASATRMAKRVPEVRDTLDEILVYARESRAEDALARLQQEALVSPEATLLETQLFLLTTCVERGHKPSAKATN